MLNPTSWASTTSHLEPRSRRTLLACFASDRRYRDEDPDELAFDIATTGFDDVLERAERLGALQRGPVQHSDWSRGLYVTGPDGRRLEFTCDDQSVYWS